MKVTGLLEDGNKPLGSTPTNTFTSVDPPTSLYLPRSFLRDKAGVLCALPLRFARRDHEVQMAAAGLGAPTFSDELKRGDRGRD